MHNKSPSVMENKALAPKLKDENGKRRKQTGERLGFMGRL